MKKILLTGARSGIAAAVLDKIKDRYYIYLTVHTLNELEIVKEKYKDYSNIQCFKLDITDKDDLKKVENLDIDILVSNAAVCYGGSISEIDINKLRNNFEVNVFSNFELIQIVLKKMLKKDSGKIIIMSSLAGIIPISFMDSYSATKASIIKLTVSLKKELRLINSNVKVCMIEPGFYKTGFNQFMFLNKYDNKDSYFKEELNLIKTKELFITNFIEKKNLDSIVNKIVTSIDSEKPKFIYRAPLSQVIAAKTYQLIFE